MVLGAGVLSALGTPAVSFPQQTLSGRGASESLTYQVDVVHGGGQDSCTSAPGRWPSGRNQNVRSAGTCRQMSQNIVTPAMTFASYATPNPPIDSSDRVYTANNLASDIQIRISTNLNDPAAPAGRGTIAVDFARARGKS